MKQARFRRTLSALLSAAMLLTLYVPAVSAAEADPAPPAAEARGLLSDAGFEEKALGPNGNPVVGNWNDYNYTRQQEVVHQGAWAVKSKAGTESTISTKVDDLIPGTTYELAAFVRGSQAGKNGADPRLGVKGHGSPEHNIPVEFTTDGWTRNAVEFVYTSGTPELYIWTNFNRSSLSIYVDDMDLRPVKGIAAFEIQNGQIRVEVAGHEGPLTAEEFVATCSVSGGAPQPLTLTAAEATAGSITLDFDAIPGAAVEQTAAVTLSYGAGTKQQVSGSFVLEKDASQVVVAQMVSADITNGSAAVVLDKVPNPLPLSADFAVSFTVDDGEPQTAPVQAVTFDKASRTALVEFTPVEGSVLGDRTAVISVTYGGKTLACDPFVVEQLTARTFYVAASGSDANDGLTPETPFRSIDKLNTLRFIPGDQILFRRGDTFQGALKPHGSGAEGAPIVISAYGEDPAKPVLEAKGTWEGEIQKAGGGRTTPVEHATYRGTIWLENVEYYEVRDLELVDPDFDANDFRVNEFPCYSAGVRVVNQNKGDLYHFVFDHLTIHGFRAMGTNFGKSGGGIQFNVLVDSAHPTDPAKNVPSAMHDITVTNCEIYDCGRSGINFLNPWGKRIGDKWPGSQEGILPWYPFTNFYMANNIFHHIDGDALITDTVANAVVEKNLCYESAIHLGYMGAAVGFFNWNSDDNYFQYNEVFNVGKNATKQDNYNEPYYVVPGDAQGIEIDALNDRTFVQYNYVHDNYGGFMMWCNVAPYYPSYDGVVRYNISENDHMNKHGIFDVFPDMYGSETYNNVFYMDPATALTTQKQLKLFHHSSATKDEHKVFNNIFYLAGDRAYPVESWGNTAINWQSNIFYNITGAPGGSNMTFTADDPLFVDPGKGYTGRTITAYRGLDQLRKDLEGYKLMDDSPAIDAGQWCPSMAKGIPVGMTGKTIPMHDFFGKTVTGIPDIGVHESDVVALNLTSDRYPVNQRDAVVLVDDVTTGQALLDGLHCAEGLSFRFLRGTEQPDLTGYVLSGDRLLVTDGTRERTYTVRAAATDGGEEIPVEHLSVVAGNQHNTTTDAASNVLTGNGIWHTAWGGSPRADHWIYLKLNDDAPAYRVTGMTFLPRQDKSINGVVTSYKLLGSTDGSAWTEITQGTWELSDRSLKTVLFDGEDRNYTYYKLQVLEAGSDGNAQFASMAKLRLLGHELSAELQPAAPEQAQAAEVTQTTAAIRWTAPAQAEDIVRYVIRDAAGKPLAIVPASAQQVVLTGLAAGTAYTGLVLTAENGFDVASQAVAIPAFTTLNTEGHDPADAAAAAQVDALIGAIGTVTPDSKAAIDAARTAYDGLTEAQKALVTKLEVLMAAEEAFAQLDSFIGAEALRLSADRFLNEQGNVAFHLTLDQPENLVAVEIHYTVDAMGAKLTALGDFTLGEEQQTHTDGKLVGTAALVLNRSGKLTSDALVDLLTIEVSGADNARPTLEITGVTLAGRDSAEHEHYGKLNSGVLPAQLTYRLAYDINNDGVVNLLDVVAAQRWFHITDQDADWVSAEYSDVDGNGTVDIEDLILILLHYTAR